MKITAHINLWTSCNGGSAGLFSCKVKWGISPPVQPLKDTEVTEGSEQSVEQGTLSAVMAHIEINLWSRSVVLMLNKPCQETALHILSSTVGADEIPLQCLGRRGFAFLYYIQRQAESHSSMHHLKTLHSFHLQHHHNYYLFNSEAASKYTHKSLLTPCISML